MKKSWFISVLLTIAIIIIIIVVQYVAWPNEPLKISIGELRKRPDIYHGKFIQTTGVIVSGFESGSAISDTTIERDGVIYLQEPAVYLDNATVQNKRDCSSSSGFPPVMFCTVDVEGIFEYGGSYGHASFRSSFQIRGIVQPSPRGPVTPPGPAEQKNFPRDP